MKTLFSFAKCLSSNKEVGSGLAGRNHLLNLFSSVQFALIPEASFSKAGGEVFYGPIKGFYKAGCPRITDEMTQIPLEQCEQFSVTGVLSNIEEAGGHVGCGRAFITFPIMIDLKWNGGGCCRDTAHCGALVLQQKGLI